MLGVHGDAEKGACMCTCCCQANGDLALAQQQAKITLQTAQATAVVTLTTAQNTAKAVTLQYQTQADIAANITRSNNLTVDGCARMLSLWLPCMAAANSMR